MEFNKKLLSIFAIFCIIVSASAVCAAEHGGYAGSNYHNMMGVSGSQYNITGVGNQTNVTQLNGTQTVLEPGAGLPLENQTGPVHLNAAGEPLTGTAPSTAHPVANITGNAAGHPVANATGNATGSAAGHPVNNSTNATGNSGNSSASHSMLPTGNPILALF